MERVLLELQKGLGTLPAADGILYALTTQLDAFSKGFKDRRNEFEPLAPPFHLLKHVVDQQLRSCTQYTRRKIVDGLIFFSFLRKS